MQKKCPLSTPHSTQLPLFLFVLNLLISFAAFSGEITYSSHFVKSAIALGERLSISDPLYPDEQARPNDFVARRSCLVSLRYDRHQGSDLDSRGHWKYVVHYELTPTGQNSPKENGVLTIRFLEGDYIYEDVKAHQSFDYPDVTLTINQVEACRWNVATNSCDPISDPHASSFIPEDLSLRLQMHTERYQYLNPAASGWISYDASREELIWSWIPGAEEYDIEWTFIDEETQVTFPVSQPAAPFEYKEPVRIRTADQHYHLDPIYPAGTLYFRYRAVGRFIRGVGADYSHLKNGHWQYANSPTPPTAFSSYTIAESYEKDKNWQYTIHYSEDGKNKRVMSYYDGSMRQRQSLSNLSSEGLTVIGETKYDYEGRPAVHVLPTPVSGQDLHYRENFNVIEENGSLVSFEKEHFDQGQSPPMASPVGGSYGAAQYYSGNNPFRNKPFSKQIPDAEGYAYTQQQYSRDNTGRIRSQSGVGAAHKLGSGHETRYYYGNPTSTELHRLFGKNVGKASHYKKNMVMDANGQISVSYLDQEGRSIATALAGRSPGNLISLGHPSEDISVDLTGNNVTDTARGTLTSVNKILNYVPNTLYSFTYDMEGVIYRQTLTNTLNGEQLPLCLDCIYELSIRITGPDGVALVIDTGAVDSTSRQYRFSNPQNADCTNNSYSPQASTIDIRNINFSQPGAYTVTKVLRVVPDEQDLQNQITEALAGLEVSLQEMIEDYQSQVDTTDCDVTCEELCRSQVLEAHPEWTPGVDDAQIDAAVASCVENDCRQWIDESLAGVENGSKGDCAYMAQRMNLDVSPGGHQHESADGIGATNISAFWSSVQSSLSSIVFYDLDGVTPSTLQPTSIADIKNNWQDSWAGSLLPFHREYCHYRYCLDLDSSRYYDLQMAQIKDIAIAQNSGHHDPLAAPAKDPFTDLTIDLSTVNLLQVLQLMGLERYGYPTLNVSGVQSYSVFLDHWITNYFDNSNGILAGMPAQMLSLSDFVNDPDNPAYAPANNLPYNDENRWKFFRGVYLQMKYDIIHAIKQVQGCTYYDDLYTIVKEPKGFRSQEDLNDFLEQYAGFFNDCEYLCQTNVQLWMDELDQAYSLYSMSQQVINDVEQALLTYCLTDGCGSSNPLGLILQEAVDGGQLDEVITILSGAGMNISVLVDSDPYIPCEGDIEYVEDLSGFFKSLIPFVNNEFLSDPNWPASPDHLVLSNYQGDSRYTGLFGTSVQQVEFRVDHQTMTFNNHYCPLFYALADGLLMDFSGITQIANPVYDPMALIVAPPGTGYSNTWYYGIRVEITVNGQVKYAYVHGTVPLASFTCFDFFQTDTIPCIPEIDPDSLYQMDAFDFGAMRRHCVQFLMDEAAFQAQSDYNRLIEDLQSQILEEHHRQCLSSSLKEDFYADYAFSEHHYTLYYYDQSGLLVQTVPPQGVKPLDGNAFTNGVWDGSTQPDHSYKTRYRYNSLNQVIEQETPDGGLTRFWYNYKGTIAGESGCRAGPAPPLQLQPLQCPGPARGDRRSNTKPGDEHQPGH